MNKLTDETMLRLTAAMPMKQINLTLPIPKSLGESYKVFGEMGYIGGRDALGWPIAYKPYIQRHYAGTFRDGSDLWLHRFLSGDGDRHLHSHPFEFKSVMLCGGYSEEFINSIGEIDHRITLPNPGSQLPEILEQALMQISTMHSCAFASLVYGASQSLDVYDWHRIAAVNDGTWTAVIVEPKRLPKWFFKDDNGDLSDMIASPRDWWKNYKVRPEIGIAVDDNRLN